LDTAEGEVCDDGNTNNDDGCSDSCQIEVYDLALTKVLS
jgi:cysteine-rich repeat protein